MGRRLLEFVDYCGSDPTMSRDRSDRPARPLVESTVTPTPTPSNPPPASDAGTRAAIKELSLTVAALTTVVARQETTESWSKRVMGNGDGGFVAAPVFKPFGPQVRAMNVADLEDESHERAGRELLESQRDKSYIPADSQEEFVRRIRRTTTTGSEK